MGRTRRDALADHPGGCQSRPLLPGAVCRAGRRTLRSGHAVVFEEKFWGDAGIALSIVGSASQRRRWPPTGPRSRSASGCRRCSAPPAIPSWPPSVLRNPAPAPTSERSAPARNTTRPPTSGCSTAPRRGHQRRNRQRPYRGGIGGSRTGDPRAGDFIVPSVTQGLYQGQKFKKHGIRASHTAEVVLDDVHIPGELILGAGRTSSAGAPRSGKGIAPRARPP